MELKEYCIIPDVHNHWRRVQTILKFIPPTMRVVFLGDYVDNFNETSEDVTKIIKLVRDLCGDPRFTFLVGNHDMAYFSANKREYACSGYKLWKQYRWDDYFTPDDIKKYFKPAIQLPGYLLSHAGFSKSECATYKRDPAYLDVYFEQAINGQYFPIFGAGFARGGNEAEGGILWRDFHAEFKPIRGVNQIFGHTRIQKPVNLIGKDHSSSNWNLDTGLNHFMVLRPQHDSPADIVLFSLADLERPAPICDNCGECRPEVFYHSGLAVCGPTCAEEAEKEDQ